MRWVIIGVYLLSGCGAFAMASGDADATFKAANDSYATGQFDEARTRYESLVKDHAWSANLFYNLANSYFRTHDGGRAVLNYKRALALDPRHPEAEANLLRARDETHALALSESALQRYLRPVSSSYFALLAAVCGWIALLSWAGCFAIRKSGAARVIGAAAATVAIASIAALFVQRSHNGGAAVIIRADVQARVATADNAQPILPLPPGSEVRLLEQRGDWTYAGLPNGQRGWIPANAAEAVRL